MAKKKKLRLKPKLNKKQRALAWAIAVPVIVGLLCLNAGILGTRFLEARKQPSNLVWATDNTVQIPTDLRRFLMERDECKGYLGTDNQTGVGLWGVFQTSKGKFAKIAYGCSLSLSNYIMAVKEPSGWKLVPPSEYFAPSGGSSTSGFLPRCSELEKYRIDKSIESFCITPEGAAKANEL